MAIVTKGSTIDKVQSENSELIINFIIIIINAARRVGNGLTLQSDLGMANLRLRELIINAFNHLV